MEDRMICFRRRYPGTELHRYYVGQPDRDGQGITVVAVQLSHPGFELVREPRRVTMPPATQLDDRRPAAAPSRGRQTHATTPAVLPEEKRCSDCAEVKPAAQFYSMVIRGRQTLHAHCKQCHGERARARRAAGAGS
jgi:hypothetical protein